MEERSRATFVNVYQPERVMNEVTMWSALAVFCSGFSWRDLHKFSTIFGMPAPLSQIPRRYLNKIDNIVQNTTQKSMTAAADELHLKVDAMPSPVPNCINISVYFDSSWRTRDFYSNIGFGSAISADKKVLDYVLICRLCEKCARWSEKRKQDNPEAHEQLYETHMSNCFKNYSKSS